MVALRCVLEEAEESVGSQPRAYSLDRIEL